jgi:hypothetical protein
MEISIELHPDLVPCLPQLSAPHPQKKIPTQSSGEKNFFSFDVERVSHWTSSSNQSNAKKKHLKCRKRDKLRKPRTVHAILRKPFTHNPSPQNHNDARIPLVRSQTQLATTRAAKGQGSRHSPRLFPQRSPADASALADSRDTGQPGK